MIFAREVSDSLTSLVKKIDEATDKNKSAKMGSFVVFVGSNESMESKLKDMVKKEDLKKIVVSTMDTPSGPPKFKIAKDADITVVLYSKKKVEANYAFEKGKMTDSDVNKIVEDISKILPKK